jgi:hypothetical protein
MKASYAGGHRIELVFDSGEQGVVELSDLVHRHRAAAPLRDPAAFAAFQLGDCPILVWPCGFAVAPDYVGRANAGGIERVLV